MIESLTISISIVAPNLSNYWPSSLMFMPLKNLPRLREVANASDSIHTDQNGRTTLTLAALMLRLELHLILTCKIAVGSKASRPRTCRCQTISDLLFDWLAGWGWIRCYFDTLALIASRMYLHILHITRQLGNELCNRVEEIILNSGNGC